MNQCGGLVVDFLAVYQGIVIVTDSAFVIQWYCLDLVCTELFCHEGMNHCPSTRLCGWTGTAAMQEVEVVESGHAFYIWATAVILNVDALSSRLLIVNHKTQHGSLVALCCRPVSANPDSKYDV